MEVTVHRKAHFNAAHRLHNSNWTEAQNQEVFGLCNNPNYHGHNYELDVAVTGPIQPDSGYVIDLKILKDIIKTEVCDAFDHKNLNLDTKEFEQLNPTAENIVVVCYQKIKTQLPSGLKLRVTLYETPRNFVTYPAF